MRRRTGRGGSEDTEEDNEVEVNEGDGEGMRRVEQGGKRLEQDGAQGEIGGWWN